MYDMDEIEIQRKIMDSIESKELREEKARWHKKYNEAENEIATLKREIDSLVSAVKTLIKERVMAIADFNTLAQETSYWDKDQDLINSLQIYKTSNNKWTWRGVKR